MRQTFIFAEFSRIGKSSTAEGAIRFWIFAVEKNVGAGNHARHFGRLLLRLRSSRVRYRGVGDDLPFATYLFYHHQVIAF
jgi:hypothetical protein